MKLAVQDRNQTTLSMSVRVSKAMENMDDVAASNQTHSTSVPVCSESVPSMSDLHANILSISRPTDTLDPERTSFDCQDYSYQILSSFSLAEYLNLVKIPDALYEMNYGNDFCGY